MNTSDVLNKAADLIEERGWQAGKGWNPEGGDPLCIEGAIRAALGQHGTGPLLRCVAAEAVRSYVGEAPWIWNDMVALDLMDELACTYAEAQAPASGKVIATLRACAVIEAARENADAREQVTR